MIKEADVLRFMEQIIYASKNNGGGRYRIYIEICIFFEISDIL